MNKRQFEVVVTSYGRNKNRDEEIRKTKKRPMIAPAIAVLLLKRKKRFRDLGEIAKLVAL